jgi:8-oxo-dGTP pyrophosphatase MutT (NUDIX family)
MGSCKTNSSDGFIRTATVLVALVLLAGCSARAAPPCPGFDSGTHAPSAGCLAVRDGRVLVVQALNGKLSPPGGSAEDGETAQCAAFRETWEETGLQLVPDRLLDVFDTGFHLYRCEHHAQSGEIDPPPRLEVKNAFYLSPAEFGLWEWRFPGQDVVLRRLAEAEMSRTAGGNVSR